jgi:uncharacterized membrane protein
MLRSLETKIINAIAAHPKLVTFGIGLAITFVIGTAVGMVDKNLVYGYGHLKWLSKYFIKSVDGYLCRL